MQGLPSGTRQVEALLLTHPQIADAAVIGIPHEESGEIPSVYVVPSRNINTTAADISR